jgi:hypothetical protein
MAKPEFRVLKPSGTLSRYSGEDIRVLITASTSSFVLPKGAQLGAQITIIAIENVAFTVYGDNYSGERSISLSRGQTAQFVFLGFEWL